MKRSEMVQKIATAINWQFFKTMPLVFSDNTFTDMAKAALDAAEKNGMLPPSIAYVETLHRDGTLTISDKCEWEPE